MSTEAINKAYLRQDDQLKAKIRLALEITKLLKCCNLNKREMADLLGIHQAKISELLSAQLDAFAVCDLLGFLVALNQDVEIMVRPRATAGSGRIGVYFVH